jgi:hypothetical protein
MLAPSWSTAPYEPLQTPRRRRADACCRCRGWLYGRLVSIARQAEDRLLAGALWQDHGLVFTSAIGMALDRHNVLREFRKITQAAGLCTD